MFTFCNLAMSMVASEQSVKYCLGHKGNLTHAVSTIITSMQCTPAHFSAQDLQSDVEHGAPLGQTEVSLTLKKSSETVCDLDANQMNAIKQSNLVGMESAEASPSTDDPM
jgi:hypothetical protein